MAVEVLVTGGDTDLGRMVAEGFRDDGHKVILVGARRSDLEVAAKELDVDAIVCDTTDPASLSEVRGLFPHHLDTIVNVPAPCLDAGDPRTYSLSDTANAWRNTLDATVLSVVLTVQAIGDHLRSGGSIISVVAENPPAGSADAAIKATLSNWVAGQAGVFGTRGITVNAVACGRSVQPVTTAFRARRRRSRPRSPGWRCSSPPPPLATSPARRCTSATARWPISPESLPLSEPIATVDTVAIRLGLQIPNFSYGTGVEKLFPTVIAQAQEAEAAGFDSLFVMDHFYQLPMLGTPDQPMLEAYTALGALATATERVQLGTLVTGNTYRNPTLLAKIITTLDVVSQGRAILGIGAGWFELEHDQLGFEFGTFTDRFNRLEEALQIILPMIKGERPTFSGKWYTAQDAMADPRFRDHIPMMIGGSGEKKTIPIAARSSDHLNVIAAFDELPRKMKASRRDARRSAATRRRWKPA